MDPYLWLMDPDPTPDPTPFFSDFKNANFLSSIPIIFNLKNLFLVLKFYFASIISVPQHVYEKREGQGSIYWKIPPPPPLGGGNKYGLMGKKYHENNASADKKEKKKERTGEKKR